MAEVEVFNQIEDEDITGFDYVLIDPIWLDSSLKYRQLILANRKAEIFLIGEEHCLGFEQALQEKIAKKSDLPVTHLERIIGHIVGEAVNIRTAKMLIEIISSIRVKLFLIILHSPLCSFFFGN